MSDAVGLKDSTTVWETPASKPLDEAVWRAWMSKGRSEDRRGRETRMRALTWGSIATVLVLTGLWFQLTAYETVIRCILTAATIGMMSDAVRRKRHALATVFGGLVVLYNPAVPLFSFSGDWPRALMFLSAIPFAVSLGGRGMKEARGD